MLELEKINEDKRNIKDNGISVIEMEYHHLRQRKQLRLNGYDYSQNGSYFVTLCVQGQKNLFEVEPYDVDYLNVWNYIDTNAIKHNKG